MNPKFLLATAGFLTVSTAAIAPAQAFTTFTFTTDYSPKPANPKKDIKLESVSFNGKTVDQFNLVNRAEIITNDRSETYQGGPGSSDNGDGTVTDATLPEGPRVENPTNADVVASLGNLNLNSIIDTEDNLGKSSINVFFTQPSNTFFLFERGDSFGKAGNSDLLVEAIDAQGKVITGQTFTITRNLWTDAGYKIDTTEITGAQKVGSYGLRSNTAIAGLRLSSAIGFNGPDYKVVAAQVPEPGVLMGLGLATGSLAMLRRRKSVNA